jgi:hypothetical protein
MVGEQRFRIDLFYRLNFFGRIICRDRMATFASSLLLLHLLNLQ